MTSPAVLDICVLTYSSSFLLFGYKMFDASSNINALGSDQNPSVLNMKDLQPFKATKLKAQSDAKICTLTCHALSSAVPVFL